MSAAFDKSVSVSTEVMSLKLPVLVSGIQAWLLSFPGNSSGDAGPPLSW